MRKVDCKKRKFRTIGSTEAEIIWSTCRQDKMSGRWKGLTEAAKKIAELNGKRISRETLRDFLFCYPKKPKKRIRKIKAEYEKKWDKTKGKQKLIDYFKKFKDVKSPTIKKYMRAAKEGWLYLKHKDPVSWTLDDFLKLKENPAWKDLIAAEQMGLKPEEAKIRFGKATAIRNVMEALGHPEWREFFKTKKLKRVKGMKVQWWLRKSDVRAITATIEDAGTKMLFLMACYTGSRISAYMSATFGSLDLSVAGNETWSAFETKGGNRVIKELNAKFVRHLKDYISMMKQAGRAGHNDKLFPRGAEFYSKQLKAGAIRAGLCSTGPDPNNPKKIVDDLMYGHRVSWHMTRHTFASQLLEEGASLQHIMQQGPWKDASTLITYYGGADRAEIRKSMNLLDLG